MVSSTGQGKGGVSGIRPSPLLRQGHRIFIFTFILGRISEAESRAWDRLRRWVELVSCLLNLLTHADILLSSNSGHQQGTQVREDTIIRLEVNVALTNGSHVAGASRGRGRPRDDDLVAMVFALRGAAQSSGGGSA